MEFAFLPLALVLIASIFQGSFGLGMKFMAPLKWEAWWLVQDTLLFYFSKIKPGILFPFQNPAKPMPGRSLRVESYKFCTAKVLPGKIQI